MASPDSQPKPKPSSNGATTGDPAIKLGHQQRQKIFTPPNFALLLCILLSLVNFYHLQKPGPASVVYVQEPSTPIPPTIYKNTAKMSTEQTFIAIKPDGVQRGLVGPIVSRFEQRGYKLVAIKLVTPGKAHLEQHYADLKDKPFFAGLVEYMNSGPIAAMVWEGRDAVKTGRTLLGATNPLASAPGTIRGDYAIDVGRNVCHGSDSVENAKKEIALWFKEGEVVSYQASQASWIYEKPLGDGIGERYFHHDAVWTLGGLNLGERIGTRVLLAIFGSSLIQPEPTLAPKVPLKLAQPLLHVRPIPLRDPCHGGDVQVGIVEEGEQGEQGHDGCKLVQDQKGGGVGQRGRLEARDVRSERPGQPGDDAMDCRRWGCFRCRFGGFWRRRGVSASEGTKAEEAWLSRCGSTEELGG
ncbi:hypothetical protein PspLS_08780 [Pyricularia sp. CBS 133598]|nr:hypothetical protein PspLS_08780 [Pyricularia sp. CBS 133598]